MSDSNILNGRWDASRFFLELTATNTLALAEGFTFCHVSGLEGFEEAVAQLQTKNAFVCVSDINDGYTELNNSPHTRRVKTVFMAMRHKADDMEARTECMEIMRELFRQFMSQLILEKVKLEQNCIYLDPRITFTEIDRYFFNGAAGAYFQIGVDCYTDLRFNPEEWMSEHDLDEVTQEEYLYDLYLTGYDTSQKISAIKYIRSMYGRCLDTLKQTKEAVEAATEKNPVLIASGLTQYQLYVNVAQLDSVNATYIFNETNVNRLPSAGT